MGQNPSGAPSSKRHAPDVRFNETVIAEQLSRAVQAQASTTGLSATVFHYRELKAKVRSKIFLLNFLLRE
jgi:hypothetical protein